MNNPRRRSSDKAFNFSGAKDVTFWVLTVFLGLIAYFVKDIHAEFKDLTKTVVRIDKAAAKRDAALNYVIKEVDELEARLD